MYGYLILLGHRLADAWYYPPLLYVMPSFLRLLAVVSAWAGMCFAVATLADMALVFSAPYVVLHHGVAAVYRW